MKLNECLAGQKIKILKINCDNLTFKRLEVIGFIEGENLTVLRQSFGSILCSINGKMYAFGNEITKRVEVECV